MRTAGPIKIHIYTGKGPIEVTKMHTQIHTHRHTHSESHIAMAWNAFYADWVQALSWSESSLEFDMRLKGAMSFQLGKSACQPTQLSLQPMLGKAIDFHAVRECWLLHVCASPDFCPLYLANYLMWTERWRKSSKVKSFYQLSLLLGWQGVGFRVRFKDEELDDS